MRWIVATIAVFMSAAVLAEDVRQACRDLVLDYAYYRDRPDAQGFANVFAKDGELTVLGETFAGKAAIAARLKDAEEGPSFRHLMSTIRIFPVDADTATGVSYVTVYSAPPGETTVEGFLGVGEYHDEFVRTVDGWKIKKRVFVPVYSYEDES